MNSRQLKVGILGCTGLVGQRLIETLDSHPVFKVSKLFGREEKRGELYFDVVNWACSSRLDTNVASMEICSVDDFPAYEGLNLLFSALPADVALNIEGKLRNAGYGVISNAKSFRLDVEVPLLVPEIDIKGLELIDVQKKKYGGGFIATNPNCSVIGISLALGPIEKALGIKSIQIVTMQAMSGAGLNGLSSKEFMANLVPNILGEEEKIREVTYAYPPLERGYENIYK